VSAIDKLLDELTSHHTHFGNAIQLGYKVKAELAALQADRERYMALLAHPEWVIMQQGDRELYAIGGVTQWHSTINAAIDAAMKGENDMKTCIDCSHYKTTNNGGGEFWCPVIQDEVLEDTEQCEDVATDDNTPRAAIDAAMKGESDE